MDVLNAIVFINIITSFDILRILVINSGLSSFSGLFDLHSVTPVMHVGRERLAPMSIPGILLFKK